MESELTKDDGSGDKASVTLHLTDQSLNRFDARTMEKYIRRKSVPADIPY